MIFQIAYEYFWTGKIIPMDSFDSWFYFLKIEGQIKSIINQINFHFQKIVLGILKLHLFFKN